MEAPAQESDKKIRVLALCDYCCSTGFATVSSNVLREVDKTGRYQIDVVGINYTGDPYDEKRFPGNVFPALTIANLGQNGGDPYGRQKFLDLLSTGVYDVVFIIQDAFIVADMIKPMRDAYVTLEKKFKTVFYFPFDSSPKKEWVEKVIAEMDFPVAYTRYAEKLCLEAVPDLKKKLKVIYHGTNVDEFKPVEDESGKAGVKDFRSKYFAGKADGKFLITNVNRNQSRKDVVRNLMILSELKKRGHKDIVLYLHMAHSDQGGNILVMADHFGLKLQEDFILPSPRVFNPNQGIPVQAINLLYNASQLVLTTTLGEGWGLSVTEAMATKTPVVAPDNTSLTEMLADNRGYLVKSGATPSMWITKEQDNERLRPLMDVEDAADKIELVKDGKLPDIDLAYRWAREYSWENVCKDWIKIFDQAALEARTSKPTRQERRRMEREQKKMAKQIGEARDATGLSI